MLKEIAGEPLSPASAISPETPHSAIPEPESKAYATETDKVDIEDDEEFAESDIDDGSEPTIEGATDLTPASSTRSKARQRKKA